MTGTAAYIFSRLEHELENLPAHHNEIAQHLMELGYINLRKVNALWDMDYIRAKAQFMLELSQSKIFDDEYIHRLTLTGEENMLVFFLRRFTDIDEGITISKLPNIGELNLITRIIHYRLDLFGLWPMQVEIPFSALTTHKLNEIGLYAKCNTLDAFNYLADVESLTKHLLDIHPAEKFILIFRSPKVTNETKKKLDRRGAFQRQLLEDFGERTDFFRYIAKQILKSNPDKVDFSFLNKEAINPFKRFIMRLIQVHQWQEGFYNGLLDSNMGEVTVKSMLDTIGFYNSSDNRNIKTHRAITYVHNGYFVFNSLFFLQEYMIEDGVPEIVSGEDQILIDISNELENAGEEEQDEFTINLEKLKSDIYNDANKKPQQRKGFLQRIYFGTKQLLKKAFRFARKIFSWIKTQASKAWGFLKKLFRNYFENLRSGIKAFVDGFKFLFGQKFIESSINGQMIASKFSIDGDSVSITSNQIGDVLETHLHLIGYNIKSMKFTLAIVTGVLKLIIGMINIISWPLLLVNIIKIYKNISISYQEIKII